MDTISVRGFHLPHGNIYIYGEGGNYYRSYMDGILDCVEDACDYARGHNMKIFYEIGRCNIWKLVQELFRVTRLNMKYGVYSSSSNFLKYVEEQVIVAITIISGKTPIFIM